MKIVLYSFNKRENSTAVPGTGMNLEGDMVGGSSVTAPVFSLNIGDSSILAKNYLHIPEFNRYYFIREWTFDRGRWLIECEIDALASWRSSILNSTQYVLRSASSFDGDIIDSLYPTKNNVEIKNYVKQFFDIHTLGVGSYVVSIVNNDPNNTGGVTEYVFTKRKFATLLHYLLDSPDYLDIAADEIAPNLLKALFNPAQYITSCMYLPVPPDMIAAGNNTPVRLGWWTTTAMAAILNPENAFTIQKTISFTKHPQTGRGNYLNGSPFTRYTLNFAPFGSFVLDANKLLSATSISVEVKIDTVTGQAILKVKNEDTILATSSAKIGISIPISQITRDDVGIIEGVASAASSLTSFHPISGAAKGISDCIKSAVPQMETRGGFSGVSMLVEQAVLTVEHYLLTDEDLDDNGRPLCKKVALSNLHGYAVVENADVKMTSTKEEQQAIKSYMEGGFFIE